MHHKYCKAYSLQDLRQFSNWTQQASAGESDLADESIVYLWDDYTVVTTPILPNAQVVWDKDSTEWREFCQKTLGFAIPEDLRPLYEEQETSSV